MGAPVVEKRREHLIVGITHPFLPNTTTCAKAVWKHPGTHKQKLTLKGPHKCKGKDFNVDPQRPTVIVTSTVPASTSTIVSLHPSVSVVQEVETVTLTV